MNDIVNYYKKYLTMDEEELNTILQRDRHTADECLKINEIL
jgi:hypothetical protein